MPKQQKNTKSVDFGQYFHFSGIFYVTETVRKLPKKLFWSKYSRAIAAIMAGLDFGVLLYFSRYLKYAKVGAIKTPENGICFFGYLEAP